MLRPEQRDQLDARIVAEKIGRMAQRTIDGRRVGHQRQAAVGDEATVVNLPARDQTEIRIGQPNGSGEFAYAYLISLTAKPDGTAVELRKTNTWFPQMTPEELETETKACARN